MSQSVLEVCCFLVSSEVQLASECTWRGHKNGRRNEVGLETLPISEKVGALTCDRVEARFYSCMGENAIRSALKYGRDAELGGERGALLAGCFRDQTLILADTTGTRQNTILLLLHWTEWHAFEHHQESV